MARDALYEISVGEFLVVPRIDRFEIDEETLTLWICIGDKKYSNQCENKEDFNDEIELLKIKINDYWDR